MPNPGYGRAPSLAGALVQKGHEPDGLLVLVGAPRGRRLAQVRTTVLDFRIRLAPEGMEKVEFKRSGKL
jgi:hypothetical protein